MDSQEGQGDPDAAAAQNIIIESIEEEDIISQDSLNLQVEIVDLNQ